MTGPVRVLVLGVGGNVSQGILKALRLCGSKYHITAACIDASAAGLYLADAACLSPPAASSSFVEWLMATCRQHAIQVVLSGVEPVLNQLATHREAIFDHCGARVVVSSPEILAIGDDKQRTCDWLSAHGFDAPVSARADDRQAVEQLVNRFGYDLFAKPRQGKGSAGICAIRHGDELQPLIGRSDYVIQQRVGTPDTEYTAATLSDRDGGVQGVIVMRRRLQHGTSVFTEIVDQPLLHEAARRIAEALRPAGPCNMQFRMHEGRPVCFELNIRFSGTTPIRAHFGFADVNAAIDHFVLDQPMRALPHLTSGRAIRYWDEVYPPEAEYQRFIGESNSIE